MKLVVFGSTGGTGREVVGQALAAGHAVTAVARNPSGIPIRHDRLNVLQGDILMPETILPAVAGQDAVVFAVGAADRLPTKIYSMGVMNVLLAMRDAGVRKVDLCLCQRT